MPLISHKTAGATDLHLPLGCCAPFRAFQRQSICIWTPSIVSFAFWWDLVWLGAFLLALSLSIRFYGLMPFSGHWALNATFWVDCEWVRRGKEVGGKSITRAYWLSRTSISRYRCSSVLHFMTTLDVCACWLFSHFYAEISIWFTSVFDSIYILWLLWIFNNFFLCLIWHPSPSRVEVEGSQY